MKASVGHVVDLPKSKLGVDIENDFAPEYQVIHGKAKIITELRQAAKDKENIYLAPDPDREGEAIAWHIAEQLDGQAPQRPPRALQRDHQAARCRRRSSTRSELDQQPLRGAADAPHPRPPGRLPDQPAALEEGAARPVGRPRAVGRGAHHRASASARSRPSSQTSTGRSRAQLDGARAADRSPPGSLRIGDQKLDPEKFRVENAEAAERAGRRACAAPPGRVAKVERKERRRFPTPPFITSRLQQEASRKLGFPPSRTMRIAQQLYEGVELGDEGPVGLITYMRTDSTRICARGAAGRARSSSASATATTYLPEDAGPLPHQEGRAGRPRGDPADRRWSGRRRRVARLPRPRRSWRSTRSSGTASSPAR